MRKLFIFLLFFGATAVCIAQAPTLDAKQIVEKAYNKQLGKSSISDMTMTIVRPEWTRTISMQNWSLGSEYYLTYIISPARDQGQVFMKRQTDMWNWMPTISRLIKIPPSMMMQSWMGSDFTNNDLMKQNSMVKDYSHKILGNEDIDGTKCWKIQLDPLPEAAVVWGQIIMYVSQEYYNIRRVEYMDDNKTLVKLEKASQVKEMGGEMIPTYLEMIPVNKKGHKTEMTITMQKFDVKDINEDFFSQQMMKRVRPR